MRGSGGEVRGEGVEQRGIARRIRFRRRRDNGSLGHGLGVVAPDR